jgi:hypothetical protein
MSISRPGEYALRRGRAHRYHHRRIDCRQLALVEYGLGGILPEMTGAASGSLFAEA